MSFLTNLIKAGLYPLQLPAVSRIATSLAVHAATIGSNAVAAIGQFASFGATSTGPGFYSYLTGDTVARVRVGLDTNDMPSLAFGPGGATTRDTFLLRTAAGTLQHGTSDVDTAPVAQTIRTQGTLAGGTSDVAGANWTFIASPGKGTGTGGSFIFQTAPAGSTGTVVNAPVTALTISSTGRATIAGGITNSGNGAASLSNSLCSGTVFTGGSGTTNFPAMFVQPTGTTAATTWSTSGTGLGMNLASGFAGNFLDFHTAGGASVFSVGSSGLLTIPNTGALIGGSARITTDLGQFTVGASNDAILTRKAAASWQYGAADAAVAVAQTTRVQSVVAGTAAANGANWTLIGSLPTGTGTSGDIIFQTGVKTGSGTTQGTPTTALTIKGENAGVIIKGTSTNDDAASGFVGEILSSTVVTGSAVSLTTATTANITSITLTPGDWDVTGAFVAVANTGTSITYLSSSISTTSATNDATPGRLALASYQPSGIVPSGVQVNIALPTTQIKVASGSTQVVYLTANCAFTVSTLGGAGIIRARRIR